MIAISGRHITKAIVERRRITRRKPFCQARGESSPTGTGPYACGTISTMVCPFRLRYHPRANHRHAGAMRRAASSGAQRAFKLVLGPLDDVVEFLATLRELRHHDGVDGLVVN